MKPFYCTWCDFGIKSSMRLSELGAQEIMQAHELGHLREREQRAKD